MKRRIRIDAKTVTAVAVAVVLLGTYWLAIDMAQRFYGFRRETASTFSQSETGLKVLYRYLDELDYDVATLTDFDVLPEGGTIVVAADTALEKPYSEQDTARLQRWVEAGGRLVLVGWQAREAIGVPAREVSPVSGAEATVSPVFPAKEVSGVEDIAVGRGRLAASGGGWITVVGDAAGSVMISRAMGAGEVVWLSDAGPLSNVGIERADNALLAVALVTVGDTPVYFDEYHHGFAFGGSLWQRLGAGGQAAVVVGGFALFFLVLARARRIGPAIVEPETPPARTAAYIDSLAELYRKAGARTEALRVLEEGLTRSLARRYGTIALGLSRRSDAAAVLEHAAAVRTRGPIDESEFVSVAGRLVRLRREVEGIDG